MGRIFAFSIYLLLLLGTPINPSGYRTFPYNPCVVGSQETLRSGGTDGITSCGFRVNPLNSYWYFGILRPDSISRLKNLDFTPRIKTHAFLTLSHYHASV